jgi:hypothetical protein
MGKNPGRILRLALVFEYLTWAVRGDGTPEPTEVPKERTSLLRTFGVTRRPTLEEEGQIVTRHTRFLIRAPHQTGATVRRLSPPGRFLAHGSNDEVIERGGHFRVWHVADLWQRLTRPPAHA